MRVAQARPETGGRRQDEERWERVEMGNGRDPWWVKAQTLAPRSAFLGAHPVVLSREPVTDDPEEGGSTVRAIVCARTAGYARKPSPEAAGSGIRKTPEEATGEEQRACRAFLSESTAGDLLTAILDGSVTPWEAALWTHAVGAPREMSAKHAILNQWAEGGRTADILA